MFRRLLLLLAAVSLLVGCGGSGGGSSSSSAASPAQETEKAWVRAYMADAYLWYNEIVDVPSANYATAPDYFDALLVKSRDRFSFCMPRADAVSMLDEGVETGYGVKWGWGATGRLFAYYVDPSSPAAVSITRGTEVTSINGQPVATLDTATLNSALFPETPGASVNLTFRAPGTGTTHTAGLTSATFSTTTVSQPLVLPLPGGGKTGYLLFNQHLLTSEQGLIDAFTSFKEQGVGELVLDLRYNTGGYLFLAEEVASMIGGAALQGRVFEKMQFNDKHPEKSNNPMYTYLFDAQSSEGATVPLLGLKRVFVLTGPNTCSASESIINGLLPHIQVIRIGWTTCGKPYGFLQANHDQEAYFAIQFEGVNADGTDDYKTGFAPTCQVSDDLNYPLGDIREARLAAALYYIDNNSCPPTPVVSLPKAALTGDIPAGGEVQLVGQKPGLKLLR